jgi:hypothetical protein
MLGAFAPEKAAAQSVQVCVQESQDFSALVTKIWQMQA